MRRQGAQLDSFRRRAAASRIQPPAARRRADLPTTRSRAAVWSAMPPPTASDRYDNVAHAAPEFHQLVSMRDTIERYAMRDVVS